MSLAFMYAGQGSQHKGMGKDLYEAFQEFRESFDSAVSGLQLDFDIKEVCFEDPQGVISSTKYTQPCMVAFQAAVTDLLMARGIKPDHAAGLSLGEYSALHAAGVFDTRTVVELAAFRGAAMDRAAAGIPAGMYAIINLDRDKLAECCEKASSKGVVSICNYNCPGQLVIGGVKEAVDMAAELAKEAGAKRALPLNVSGPFHTSLMHPAGDELRGKFAEVQFGEMALPVIFNCLGREKAPEDDIKVLLERQVQESVMMEDSIRRLSELGVDRVIEIGPGKAIAGFIKKTVGDAIKCYGVETEAQLSELLENGF